MEKYYKKGKISYLHTNKSKIGILGNSFVSTKDYPNAQPITPIIVALDGKKTFIHSNSYSFIINNRLKHNDTTQFRTRLNWASIKGACPETKKKKAEGNYSTGVVNVYHGYNYALGYVEEEW